MHTRNHLPALTWRWSIIWALIAVSLAAQGTAQHPRPFTVEDDIAITQFGDVWTTGDPGIKWSPDHAWLAVHLTSASLKDGQLHDEILIYQESAIQNIVAKSPERTSTLEPYWKIDVLSPPNDDGYPGVQNLAWLDNNQGLAYVKWTPKGTRQLCLAELEGKHILPLTPEPQDVRSYSIRDKEHFVYAVPSEDYISQQTRMLEAPSRMATGAILATLLYPSRYLKEFGRVDLWASGNSGTTHPVVDPRTNKPWFLYGPGINLLSLSTDGERLLTLIALPEVPAVWERLFPPPYLEMPVRVRAGHQDLTAGFGNLYTSRFSLISLASGNEEPLIDAPAAYLAGWIEGVVTQPVWSLDSKKVFLPGAYVLEPGNDAPKPCFAVVDLVTKSPACLREMHGTSAIGLNPGYSRVISARFNHSGQTITLTTKTDSKDYTKTGANTWKAGEAGLVDVPSVSVTIKAGPADPPKLVASDSKGSGTITLLDPNPFLKNVGMGDVKPYHWSDSLGHDWQGMLYLPLGYESGKRYPLVIQNHGLLKDTFAPSGEFPSAFAAQELASSGIAVLQVLDCSGRGTPREVECNVEAYDAAVEKLSQDGLVDAQRVGLIGFSRTVMYVLRALTTGRVAYRAASITDGLTLGLMEYAETVTADPASSGGNETLIGAPPIGQGLHKWMEGSPELNVDKIKTPLRVVAKKDVGVVGMWGPYAMLMAAHKPTELVILNTNQHVINDPRVRQAAQQGNVDWFRFWLQEYEDPDPQKREQYRSWRALRPNE